MDIFLVSSSVDAPGGGAQRARQLADLFTASGHRVQLIGIGPAATGARRQTPRPDAPYRVSTLYDAKPPVAPTGPRSVLDLRAHGRRGAHERAMRAKGAQLSALIREGCREGGREGGQASRTRPGAVVVTENWALEWVALADTAGLPVVLLSHEPYAVTRGSARYRRLRWLCRTRVDRVLAPTRQEADWWVLNWLNNVGVMPVALPGLPTTRSPRDRKCVLAVGRLDHDKGTDILLDAWAQLAPRHPQWRLLLYGEAGTGAGAGTGSGSGTGTGAGAGTGPRGRSRLAVLRQQCAELGIEDSVEWRGFTDDVPGALREGSVFVLPSRQEGFPLAPLEAMAAGLPCVAFNVSPGVREMVEDGVHGLLARRGNFYELARKIEQLMVDRELRERLGDAARENVREKYAPEAVAERWEKLFALLAR